MTKALRNLDHFLYQHFDSRNASYYFVSYFYKPADSIDEMGRSRLKEPYNLYNYTTPLFDVSSLRSLKTFMQKVSQLSFRGYNIILISDEGECSEWSLRVSYSFETFSKIRAKVDAKSFPCGYSGGDDIPIFSRPGQRQNLKYFYTLALLLVALAGLYFSWKRVYETGINYMTTRYHIKRQRLAKLAFSEGRGEAGTPSIGLINRGESDYSLSASGNGNAVGPISPFQRAKTEREQLRDILRENKSWEELSFSDKLRFFDMWLFVSIAGNFFQVLGALLSLFNFLPLMTTSVTSFGDLLLGLGCFAAWIKISSYLEYSNRNTYLLTSTLKYAFPGILKFIFGVAPLILGYVYLGRCLFWKYEKFESSSQTFITLFSFMTGDSVRDGFSDTASEGILSRVFLYSFDVLFILAVHNMFIGIICEAFEEQRAQKGVYDGPSLVKSRKQAAWNKFESEYLDHSKMAAHPEEIDQGLTSPIRTKERVVTWIDEMRKRAQSVEKGQDLAAMEFRRDQLLRKFNTEIFQIEELLNEMDVVLKDSKYFLKEKSEQASLRLTYVKYARFISNKLVEMLTQMRAERLEG
eukprot:TRINITY_DN11117_c0_g1_i3.p1 TRINITY_DN11117_c0_g1~~TRINITY_DN11117_c0_g1_i3.p1  ORF type:complete len:579 (+),score=109.86 TRINITY_DN11117_c0_g1_i3:406-2142(+)